MIDRQAAQANNSVGADCCSSADVDTKVTDSRSTAPLTSFAPRSCTCRCTFSAERQQSQKVSVGTGVEGDRVWLSSAERRSVVAESEGSWQSRQGEGQRGDR